LIMEESEEGKWITLCQNPPNSGVGLFGHSCVFYKGLLYIYGGCDSKGHFSDVFYTFDIETGTWGSIPLDINSPCPRNFHSCCVYKNEMYLFWRKVKWISL